MSRLLIVTPTYLPSWGGAERLIFEVATRLAERHEVTVLSPVPTVDNYSVEAELLRVESPVRSVLYRPWGRLDRIRGRRLHRGIVPPVDLSSYSATKKELRAQPTDAVLAFYAVPSGFGAIAAARRRQAHTVLAFIGRDVPGPGVPRAWHPYMRRLAHVADHTVYISEYCRDALFGAGARRPKSESVIGGGVDHRPAAPEHEVRALRGRLGLQPHERVVLAVQRLSGYKGVDVLIKAMGNLRDLSCRLVVVGTGTELEPLRRLAAGLDLCEAVLFLGLVPEREMPALWSAADIFAFHSYYETFGLAVAEAMAAGKPIVVSSSTALVELIDDRRSGLLVPPGDPTAMGVAIRDLLENPAEARRLGMTAKTQSADFDWDQVTDRYELALFADTPNTPDAHDG